MSYRLCEYGGVWQQPNVSTCATRKFIDIKNKVMYSVFYCKVIYVIIYIQTEVLNTTDVRNVSDIINQLANITSPSNQSQLPMDISVAVEVLKAIINRCSKLITVYFNASA